MDYERLLIAKTAQTGRIENLLLDGIREDHFYDAEIQNIFGFLVNHFKKYKQAPSFSTVREKFPLHNFEVTEDSIGYLKDQFIQQLKWRFAADAVRDIAKQLNDGPESCGNIEETFLERSRALAQVVPSASVSRLSDLENRLLEYEKPLGNQRIKLGIPEFDNVSVGFQPHEYITIMGKTGAGKSALAQYFLLNAYQQKKSSMYISLEMDSKALFARWDSMLIKEITHDDLKFHNLNDTQKSAIKKKAQELKDKYRKEGADILVMDDVRKFNVDRVYAEMVRWKPDICCIDYVSLMDSQKQGASWEKLQYATQNLKQTARTLKIPIIGIAQTNRSGFDDGPQIDNVGGSISIVQDSDLVFGLFQDQDMEKENRMQVRMLKNRDGKTTNANLYWNMAAMEIAPWSTRVFSHK